MLPASVVLVVTGICKHDICVAEYKIVIDDECNKMNNGMY